MKSTGPRVLSASEVPYNLAPISQSWGKEKPYLSHLHVRATVEPKATDAWASVKGLPWESPTWKEPMWDVCRQCFASFLVAEDVWEQPQQIPIFQQLLSQRSED